MIKPIEFKRATQTTLPTNHIAVVDISGSMYEALPELRSHLKTNLASLVKPEDTISILYFSSKGDFGTVFSGRQINSATDISELNALIDRFLRPSGCTGFVEPLKLAMETSQSLNTSGMINSLVFMTDGYDNCWRSEEILSVAAQLPQSFDNITIIEYGWYCNRDLLQKMAERSGATHVFAEGQDEYQLEFESAMKATSPRIRVDIEAPFDRAMYIYNGSYTVLMPQVDSATKESFVNVPENVPVMWLIQGDSPDQVGDHTDVRTAYALALYGVHTMNPDLVWSALKKTGDVRFINQYSNCFTKQDYSNIKVDLIEAIIDDGEESVRGIDGIDYNKVPAEDAVTVVDVLTYLSENNVSLVTSHPHFSYKRIGRKAVQKEDDTEDKLAEEIAKATSKAERKTLALKLAEHEEWMPTFEPNEGKGVVDISNLVFNSERPNVSIQTVQHGVVTIPEWVQKKYSLPAEIDTWRYRNFAIVKDAIINLKTLPIECEDEKVIKHLKKVMGVKVRRNRGTYVVNLGDVPLVNRSMVKNIKASEFFSGHVRLEALKARQKVLKHYRAEVFGGLTSSAGIAATYGKEAADFLSSQGIRDYGFSPKSAPAESTDVYMSRELHVKIKGASSLPSIAAVLKKPVEKHNAADKLVFKAIEEYNSFVNSPLFLSNPESVKGWINNATKLAIEQVRELNKSLSKTMYGIVAGHGWFTDLGDDESTHIVEVDGEQFIVSAELVEKEIKI